MTNIVANVTGARIRLEVSGPLTSGMVGVPVSFTFNEAWEGLTKTAVFRAGRKSLDCVGIDNIQTETTVPWELMEKVGRVLFLGIYGCNADGTVVIPTVWAEVGRIRPGADPAGDESTDPSQPVWAQLAAENKQQAERIEQLAEDMENLEAGNVDLTDYPTKAEMGEAIEEAVNDIPIPEVDLTNYPTKSEMKTEIADALANIPTGGGGGADWEFIEEITLAEDVSSLTFTLDKAYSELLCHFTTQNAQIPAGAKWLQAQINDSAVCYVGKPRFIYGSAVHIRLEASNKFIVSKVRNTTQSMWDGIAGGDVYETVIGKKDDFVPIGGLAVTDTRSITSFSLHGTDYLTAGNKYILLGRANA